MKPLSERACQVLARAQEMLSKRGGWKQGGYGPYNDATVPHCAVGAIKCAAYEAGLERYGTVATDCILALAAALPPGAYAGEDAVIDFNDRRRRRKGAVIALFKKAREQGGCEEAKPSAA